jgi:hypothetical protein
MSEKGKGFDMEVWWEGRSLAQKILWGIVFGIGAIGLVALFGWVVMALWNWLVPDIFGFKRISYWQAGGLTVLCWILFKGIRLGSNSNSSGDRRRRQELRRHMEAGQSSEEEGT